MSESADYRECAEKPDHCKADMLTQEQANEAAKVEPSNGAGESGPTQAPPKQGEKHE